MPQIGTPLAYEASKLLQKIEELPAGSEETALSIAAAELIEKISAYEASKGIALLPQFRKPAPCTATRDTDDTSPRPSFA